MAKRAAPEGIAPRTKKSDDVVHRRSFGRGWLATAVDKLCRKHAAGTAIRGVDPGAPLTVSQLQSLIANSEGDKPSTGAISAVLLRWQEGGYIKSATKPLAFKGFTAKYADTNLQAYLEDRSAKAAKARAAAKK